MAKRDLCGRQQEQLNLPGSSASFFDPGHLSRLRRSSLTLAAMPFPTSIVPDWEDCEGHCWHSAAMPMSASIVPIGIVIQWCVTDVLFHKRHPFISLINSHNGPPSSFIADVQSLERLCLFRSRANCLIVVFVRLSSIFEEVRRTRNDNKWTRWSMKKRLEWGAAEWDGDQNELPSCRSTLGRRRTRLSDTSRWKEEVKTRRIDPRFACLNCQIGYFLCG